METFDAIIIGFGKAGKTLAADLAKRNWRVAMIEQSDRMYGGTCINIGCIPSKTLVHQAKVAEHKAFKTFDEKKEFFRQAIDIKEQTTAALRNKNFHNLADNPLISVINGVGYFLSENTVGVDTAEGKRELTARKIFINTGSESIVPPIEGAEGNPLVYTSTQLLQLTTLPQRLVIVGGGYIGLEFASMYASFGSKVTVLESGPTFIKREDRDIAEAVKAHLEKKGITFVLNADVKTLRHNNDTATVVYTDKITNEEISLTAEGVLLATGRKPAISSLNVAAAGIATDSRGAIAVNEHLQTNRPDIYALGDVKGGLQFTYISLDDYRIVRDHLFGNGLRNLSDRTDVSYSVFIDPPLARIGLNEEEAESKGLNVRVNKLAATAIPRCKTLGETDGLMKVIIDNTTDEILGCTFFCPEAGEIINIVSVAMKAHLPAEFLKDFIYTHPSMSETFNDLFT